MDAYNIVALGISLAALVFSLLTSRRLIHLAHGGNQLPVVLEAFLQSRKPEWLPAQQYVLDKLVEERSEGGDWRSLPVAARTHVDTIGIFYDDLGKLVAHGMIDEGLVIGSYGTMIVRLWDALAPLVYAERQAHDVQFWVYFEDLATRVAATPPKVVYTKLRLRSRPPQQQTGISHASAGDAAPNAAVARPASTATAPHMGPM